MISPSGDQVGNSGLAVCKNVSCTGLLPSGSHVHNSGVPFRYDMKEIFLPSGENRGAPSSRVEKTTRTAFDNPCLGPSSARHKSESDCSRTNASSPLWRDTVG